MKKLPALEMRVGSFDFDVTLCRRSSDEAKGGVASLSRGACGSAHDVWTGLNVEPL